MARLRTVKPGFFTNDLLAEVDPLGRLLFIGLWCIADREGRLEDRPRRIKAEVLPYDDVDVDGLLSALAARGFIVRYAAGGNQYIAICNFAKHQNPHIKENASTIPAPDLHGASTVLEPEEHTTSPATIGIHVMGSSSGNHISPSNSIVQDSSFAPPTAARVGGSEKLKPQRQKPEPRASPPTPSQPPRPRDPIWDALVRVLDYEPQGKSERSNWGRVVHSLKDAGATPEQIVQAAKRWRLLYPDARLTINVFDGHWGELAERNEHSNGHQPTDPDAARAAELERVNHVLILRGETPLEELPANYPTAGLVGQGPGRAAG